MFISLRRITKSGWEKFWRDWISSSSVIVVMVVVLFLGTLLFILQDGSIFVIERLQESVDISVYLKDNASQIEVQKITEELLGLSEVQKVEYVSKEEALDRFVLKHKNENTILETLQALGNNPLLASLNIKAESPTQYESISEFLEQSELNSLIAQLDYRDRASIIERLSLLTSGIQRGILGISVVLGFIAIVVAFYTIRLAIYHSKEEIEIMRLVGASNWFIGGPFVVQGVLVGVFAAVIALALTFSGIVFLTPKLTAFLSGFDLLDYFGDHVVSIALLQLGVGVGLGTISSMIAIRKYLKV